MPGPHFYDATSDNGPFKQGYWYFFPDNFRLGFGDGASGTPDRYFVFDGSNFNLVGGSLTIATGGITITSGGFTITAGGLTVTAGGIALNGGNLTIADDLLLQFGGAVNFLWETADANANALFIELPSGGGVDVPVIVIGEAIESIDLGLYNGIVDPTIGIFGSGAVTTAPVLEFRKARGTIGTPTVITTGDELGSLHFYGYSGAGGYVESATIEIASTGTIATTRVGGQLLLRTATDAAPSVLTTAITIGSNQRVTCAAGLTVSTGTVTLPAGTILQAALEEGSMRFIDKQLTNANVLALATGAGIELIATPGADKSIIVHSVHFVSDASNTAWTEPSAPDDLVVQYAGGTDITGAIEAGALVANSVNVRKYGVLDTELTPEANVGVNLFNTGSNWGGGNAANTMSVRIWYSVIDTIAFS